MTGLYAGSAIMMALYERNRSGRGQEINVCLLDSALTLLHPFAANYMMLGTRPVRMGSRHPAAAPYDVYPAKDGHILVCAVTLHNFRTMCDILGVPELGADPRLQTAQDRVKHSELLTKAMKPLFAKHDKTDLAIRLLTAGVPAAPVLEIPEILAHPQVKAREMVLEAGDGYRAIGMPIKMSRTPGKLRRMPPIYGEHNREVLREAGFDDSAIDTLIQGGIVLVEQRKT
ncbi:MAG: CoA transferase [Alphaproteobacteria bacterium]